MSEEPVPRRPGRPVELGDHQVYVRGVPDEGGEPALCVPGQVAAEIGILLGNAGSPRPVDRGAGRDARAPVR